MSSGGNKRGASALDKGKSIIGESAAAAQPQEFPQDYWQFSEDEEVMPTGPPPPANISNPNVDQAYTQESIHLPTESQITNRKSGIWAHFNRVERFERGPKCYDLICKHCSKEYKYIGGQGYGTFNRHLSIKHPTLVGIDNTQQQISRYGNPNTQLFRYDDNVYKDEFSKMLCVEHLSYSFGEKVQFNTFMNTAACPQAKRIPRNTAKRTINKLYGKEKNNLCITFSKLIGSVHIGSDIWSDHWQTNSYMGVTCHWIDDDFNIQKRVLAYRVMEGRHTAMNIYILLKEILEEYGLVHKIFSVGFDNASANTASIGELELMCKPSFGGKFFHIRCACHVLNLCVQDGLKTLDMFISPIKSAIQFLWRHPQIMREWKKFCKTNGKKGIKFSRDVPTRWNSTYELLSQSMPYADLLSSFISKNAPTLTLFPQQWEICAQILRILSVFNNATYKLSGVYYPTSHLFLIESIDIVDMFLQNEQHDILNTTIANMRAKWLVYYKHIPFIYLVATFFDPRSKIDGLVEYLNIYYECLHLMDDDEINIRTIELNIRHTIFELYQEFSVKYNLRTSQSSDIPSTNIDKLSRAQQILAQRTKKQKGAIGSNNEIDNYINTSFEFNHNEDDGHFPILLWWKNHENQFPILALIAKQILATPCSTVAVEQTFSAGGNILDERRSRLHPDNLEAQVCLADWTKAANRQQEMDRTNNDFFDEEGETTTTTGTDDD